MFYNSSCGSENHHGNVLCQKRDLKYSNVDDLIFQIRQEIYCLGFYNSERHDTFLIRISTSQVNRTGNILQDAVFL